MHAAKRQMIMLIIGTLVLLVSSICFGTGIPDKININMIQKYYAGVEFNHASHISNLKDCGLCHHHTTGAQVTNPNCARCHKNSGAQPVVGCSGCHAKDPFSPESIKQQRDQQPPVYHRDKPGLKGAYHMSCLGCHKSMGGPTGCEDCHGRNEKGDELFRAGKFAPKAPAKQNSSHH